MSNNTFL